MGDRNHDIFSLGMIFCTAFNAFYEQHLTCVSNLCNMHGTRLLYNSDSYIAFE